MTFFCGLFCCQLSQRYFLWTVRSSHPLYPHIPNNEKLTCSLQDFAKKKDAHSLDEFVKWVKKSTIQIFLSKSQIRMQFFQMRWKSNHDMITFLYNLEKSYF